MWCSGYNAGHVHLAPVSRAAVIAHTGHPFGASSGSAHSCATSEPPRPPEAGRRSTAAGDRESTNVGANWLRSDPPVSARQNVGARSSGVDTAPSCQPSWSSASRNGCELPTTTTFTGWLCSPSSDSLNRGTDASTVAGALEVSWYDCGTVETSANRGGSWWSPRGTPPKPPNRRGPRSTSRWN